MDMRSFYPFLLALALAACSSAEAPLTGSSTTPGSPRGAQAPSACVDFGLPGVGTQFGSFATPPGSAAWTENGIRLTVESFVQGSGETAYNVLRTEVPPAGFRLAHGNTGRANNIAAGIDFSGLPFVVRTVRFNFLHQAGYENLAVNGSPVFVGELSAAPASLGGLAVASAAVPVRGGSQGTVTLSGGSIGKVVVGGQELWLDNVCAYG